MIEEYDIEEPEIEEIEEIEEPEVEEPEPEVAEEPEPLPVMPVVPVMSGEVSIHMRALVYSRVRRNSASVAVLQGRLSDVGYAAARADLRGWYHDNTRAALAAWQADNGLEATGACDPEGMRRLFDGTGVTILP